MSISGHISTVPTWSTQQSSTKLPWVTLRFEISDLEMRGNAKSDVQWSDSTQDVQE